MLFPWSTRYPTCQRQLHWHPNLTRSTRNSSVTATIVRPTVDPTACAPTRSTYHSMQLWRLFSLTKVSIPKMLLAYLYYYLLTLLQYNNPICRIHSICTAMASAWLVLAALRTLPWRRSIWSMHSTWTDAVSCTDSTICRQPRIQLRYPTMAT